MYKKFANPSFWTDMQTKAEYKSLIDGLKREYSRCSKKSNIGFYEFVSYRDTGLREGSDSAYFERERYFHCCLFLSLIYPKEEKYIKELHEIIWAICNDFTWERAAHMEHMENIAFQEIALGGCQMASKLAQTKLWLGERLDPVIRERIHYEIKKRYLIPFQNFTWGWEVTKCNWAATCAGGMGVAFMLEFPEEFYTVKPKLDSALEYFLSSFSKEGVCLEGVGYWGAIGHFLHYASCLYEFTDGKDDYLKDERIHNIAKFLNHSYLRGNQCVAFSDCYSRTKTNVGLSHFLHAIYPDVDLLALSCYDMGEDEMHRMLTWWEICKTNILYFNPEYMKRLPEETTVESEFFAPDAAWYIHKGKKYSLAAKGGHNDEPHNHNDVGSFHLVTDSGQQFADVGPSLYTDKNFNDNFRYEIFGNSSFGHNLPIIDEKGQKNGREFEGEISIADGIVLIQASKAYDNPSLLSFERRIKCEKNLVRLKDRFIFDSASHKITERFVTPFAPETNQNIVSFGDVSIDVKSDQWEIDIKEFEHISNSDFVGKKEKVYAVDFTKSFDSTQDFEMHILINV